MLQETTDIQELSLEKVIETKLVQNNVTQQVLSALKEKYGNMKLAALDDKESYLEIKAAAKDCAKVRNLAGKLCKEGRERAVKEQKLWIAKEKEIVAEVAVVEDPLDAEIARFDAEVERKANEEKKRQEDAYIGRQAALTKMGATYEAGHFILGGASFEAELIKGASQDVWEEAIIPKFQAEYEIIEAERIAIEKKKSEEEAEIRRQREELTRQQEDFRLQHVELQRQKDEAERAERDRLAKEQVEKDKANAELQRKRFEAIFPYNKMGTVVNMQTLWTLPEGEFNEILESKKAAFEAHKSEQERIAEERRIADIETAKQAAIRDENERKLQEEARKAEELAQSSDKEKFADLISKFEAIAMPEMRSGQYRRKVQVIRDKVNEILAL